MQPKFLPVATAVEKAVGHRPNPTTCWRWYTSGSRGVVLKTWMVGGRRMSTVAAVNEFIEQRTESASPSIQRATRTASVNRQLAAELN